ncbi:MAG: hypothetical protein KAH23_06940 [Kiritimatiellae bacterium]|nr:hypothetical protein [Kiritimatiellia bacterium]
MGNRIRLMISVDRHIDSFYKYGHVLLVLTALSFLAFCLYASRLSVARNGDITLPETMLAWPDLENENISSPDWTILAHGNISTRPGPGRFSKRFRLAGTFFAFLEGMKSNRKAILHNLENGKQTIVSERETVSGYAVLKIFQDRVVLRGPAGEEELWLSFSAIKQGQIEAGIGSDQSQGGGVANKRRFGGKQVGKNSWVFQRKPLMDYYSELMDDPTRLYEVFQSLKPIYGDRSQITGYQLGIEGEQDFFDAVGLGEGDIVRKVNSLPMTNRRRAEYFIGQFAKDRANAFLVDIERDGRPLRLSYSVR